MNKRRLIYADHAATSPLAPEALEAMLPWLQEAFANPSSLYARGRQARKAVAQARETIAACLHAEPEEIFFTSGGTESDNWAVRHFVHVASTSRRRRLITSPSEHHAVLHSCQATACALDFVELDARGHIVPESFQRLLSDEVAGMSIMLANNEVGTIADLKTLTAHAHRHGILCHSDAVQAVGHMPLDVRDLGVDLLSASAHKFNGPKGCGFLYIKRGTPEVPLLHGGQQEGGRRAGTENVAAIVGMAAALKLNCEQLAENSRHLRLLSRTLRETLTASGANVVFHSDDEQGLPGLVSVSFPGCSGESLLHLLDLRGIAVSTGAACNSRSTDVSHVLQALHLPDAQARGTLRISWGKGNTVEEARHVAHVLLTCIA